MLHVRVIEGHGLLAADANGLSDPYCNIKLGEVKHRTKTIPCDVDPIWDQGFSFPVFDLSQSLEVVVWDRDQFTRDDFLGKVRIPLEPLLHVPQLHSHAWYPLWDKKVGGARRLFHFLSLSRARSAASLTKRRAVSEEDAGPHQPQALLTRNVRQSAQGIGAPESAAGAGGAAAAECAQLPGARSPRRLSRLDRRGHLEHGRSRAARGPLSMAPAALRDTRER
jgi:hypothetical protein